MEGFDGTVLGVWAHPDDETYLSAGLMAEAARDGRRVMCVTATRGEGGSMDEDRWPPETMGEVRPLVFEPQAQPEEHHEGGDERSIPERGDPP